jgi:hypothetical protein
MLDTAKLGVCATSCFEQKNGGLISAKLYINLYLRAAIQTRRIKFQR